MMRYSALVPMKVLNAAKSRLATELTPSQRAALALDMLHHVITTLQQSHSFERIAVVSSDATVAKQAHTWGAQVYGEDIAGHNPALHAAALQERTAGTEALLTISADLPLLQQQDIERLLHEAQRNDVVLASSRDGTGTNALLTYPPLAVPYVFGPQSLPRYQWEAQQRQLRSTIVHSPGLALDIDTKEDLELLHQRRKTRQTTCPLSSC